ncbi:MAG: chemotaxis-specific protein-glutamate methyltransferase CheB [Burkholderiaceae bacterium]|nr:chemotaxis-specific protein-glutamate methyltransferase CheB [Burkholderiaceae bacterium]
MNDTLTRIRILLVEDSPVIRELLLYILGADPAMDVVAVAEDGEQAVVLAQQHKPDIVLMDIHLPKLDGFAATRQIMESCPTRVVVITATSIPDEIASTFEALDSGALTVMAKPPGIMHPDHKRLAEELRQTVRLMSEVRVVKRWPRQAGRIEEAAAALHDLAPEADIRLVAMGASTGGPLVLRDILSRLQRGFSAPILIVQHISTGFSAGFVEWLAHTSGYDVRLAAHGEMPRPGAAYVAPDGRHMAVAADGSMILQDAPPENGMCPSVSYLFRSVAVHCGPRAAGVLLTGMGCDGAQELKQMRAAGAVTIAQSQESSTVFGMPGEAIHVGAATYVLAPQEIAAALMDIVKPLK